MHLCNLDYIEVNGRVAGEYRIGRGLEGSDLIWCYNVAFTSVDRKPRNTS